MAVWLNFLLQRFRKFCFTNVEFKNPRNIKMKWKEFIGRLTHVVDAKYYGSIIYLSLHT